MKLHWVTILLLSIALPISAFVMSASQLSARQKAFLRQLPIEWQTNEDVTNAIEVVQEASIITQRLQPDQSTIQTVQKDDLSPVTVADFAVQASILHALQKLYPSDGFIAEEDSKSLRADSTLAEKIAKEAGLPIPETLSALDIGKSYQSWTEISRPPRVWCLDPIDGTKGFLRKKTGQYAIALALLENGVPTIGVLGCPNLPIDDAHSNMNGSDRGCVFVASRGCGCYQISMDAKDRTSDVRRIETNKGVAVQDARFCIAVERYSDHLGQCVAIAEQLQGANAILDNEIRTAIRMDSQAKHGMIARGSAELYVRLPKPGYVEWIWDHAAGYVVIEEAGGTMTDTTGNPLNFSLGPQLSPSVRGVLMSSDPSLHALLVKASSAVLDTFAM